MTIPLPQVRQGRDGATQFFKLLNELRRYAYRGPGVSLCISDEEIGAFSCVATDPTTGNLVLARADGTNYASGVLVNGVLVGELAIVLTAGVVEGAVSGRVANDPVWVGPDGTLVFAAPGVGNYVQPIAVCVSATDIYVHPEVPVI
jgi:hypothetical protein